jgi:hypothetical protein
MNLYANRRVSQGEGGDRMYVQFQRHWRAWVLAAVLIAAVIAVVLLIAYSGGSGGGGY